MTSQASLLYVGLRLSRICRAPDHHASDPHSRTGMARVLVRWCIVRREASREKASVFRVGSMLSTFVLFRTVFSRKFSRQSMITPSSFSEVCGGLVFRRVLG